MPVEDCKKYRSTSAREGMEVMMKRSGLLFTSQEKRVLCFWSAMLCKVWQIDFIFENIKIAYQLGNYIHDPEKVRVTQEKVP